MKCARERECVIVYMCVCVRERERERTNWEWYRGGENVLRQKCHVDVEFASSIWQSYLSSSSFCLKLHCHSRFQCELKGPTISCANLIRNWVLNSFRIIWKQNLIESTIKLLWSQIRLGCQCSCALHFEKTHAEIVSGNATLNYKRTACVYTPFSLSFFPVCLYVREIADDISRNPFLSLIISFFNLSVAYAYLLPSGGVLKGPKSVKLLHKFVYKKFY